MAVSSFSQDDTILPLRDTIIPLPPPDTTKRVDTIQATPITPTPPAAQDTFEISKRPMSDTSWAFQTGSNESFPRMTSEILAHHPWLGFTAKPISIRAEVRRSSGKELMFYSLIAFLILYALLRRAFPKYYNDLFRLFFRTTLKQRQIKEQLMQTPLPSLLMNGFFILSAGLYIGFILQHYNINPVGNFWLLCLYCCIGLSVAYFAKFLGLKVSGWLFNMRDAADSYIFIVFVVNKMIGIMLLPFIFILAFTTGDLYLIGLNISFALIAGLLLYRFILTFASIRNQVKVNPFHFFLYLLAFEIAPLLLIYKLLLQYVL
jgi:hypothetical protein